MIVPIEYKRRDDESEIMYKFRICELCLTIGGWQKVADILNAELGLNYSESAYRKPHNYYKSIQSEFESNEASKLGILTELEESRIKSQVEIQKLKDLTNRYKSYIRDHARFDSVFDAIVDAIRTEIKLSDPVAPLQKVKSQDRQPIAFIADAHDGAEFDIKGLFGESLNKYSPEIFEQRMWKYAEEIIAIANKEKLYSWKIMDLGDSVEGILRISSLNFLRYGSSEAAVHYAKFMAKWLKYLSRFIYIDFYAVPGNHDDLRLLTAKKGDFPNETVSIFINEIIKASLADNPNVTIIESQNKKIFVRLFDKYSILATHGEERDQISSLQDYQDFYGVTINYLFGAHKHFMSTTEAGFDKMVIRVRSIVGVNNFAEFLIKSANPGANIFIFEDSCGLKQQYNINLSDRD